MEVTVWTMKGIYMSKRNHSTQIISCKPWPSQLCPCQSLARKMKTYFELKDQVPDPPHPDTSYTERPKTQSPQKVQASRNKITKESKNEAGISSQIGGNTR